MCDLLKTFVKQTFKLPTLMQPKFKLINENNEMYRKLSIIGFPEHHYLQIKLKPRQLLLLSVSTRTEIP